MGLSSEQSDVLTALVSRVIEVGADELEVEYKSGQEEVFALRGGIGFGIASFRSTSKEAASLLKQLRTIGKKRKTIEVFGATYELRVSVFDSFGEDAFRVQIRQS